MCGHLKLSSLKLCQPTGRSKCFNDFQNYQSWENISQPNLISINWIGINILKFLQNVAISTFSLTQLCPYFWSAPNKTKIWRIDHTVLAPTLLGTGCRDKWYLYLYLKKARNNKIAAAACLVNISHYLILSKYPPFPGKPAYGVCEKTEGESHFLFFILPPQTVVDIGILK